MQIYGIFTENQEKYVKNRGKCVENRGNSEEFIPQDGRTKGRSCGRFQSFPVVFAVIPGENQRISENFRENQRISGKIIPFLSDWFRLIPIDSGKSFLFFPFSFLFIPFLSPIPRFYALQHVFETILSEEWKFLAFFLVVPDFLRTFANGYKMIVVYPAGRPFRLWLLAAGFFYA